MALETEDQERKNQERIILEQERVREILQVIAKGRDLFCSEGSTRAAIIRSLRHAHMTIKKVNFVFSNGQDAFLDANDSELRYETLRIQNAIKIIRASLDWVEEAADRIEMEG